MKTLLLIVFAFFTLVAVTNPAEEYWARVGWDMDKTLNPCKYTLCQETDTEISP